MKRRPVVILIFAVLLTLLATWRVTTLRPESSLDGLLDPHDPATAAMGRVLRDFPLAEEMLVLVSLPAGDDDATKLTDFAERLSGLLAKETTFVAATRYRAGDDAKSFVQTVMAPNGLLYLSDEQLAAADERLTPNGMREQLARSSVMLSAPGPAAGGLAKALAQDPLRLHEFLLESLKTSGLPATAAGGDDAFRTTDGRGLLVRIEGKRPPGELTFSTQFTDAVDRAAAAANTSGLTVKVGGAYAIAAHNAAAIRHDSIESTIVSTAALAALFGLLYRRPVRTFALAFTPVVMGLLWGFGLYACLRETITPLAAVIGGVLGGVGIDYPVHLMAHRRENETPGGTARRLAAPLVAAFLTSVAGFAAVAWSPLRVLRDFALIGSLGLLGAWLATVTVLPALLSLVGERSVGAAATRGGPAARLWPIVSKCPGRLVWVGCIAFIVAATVAVFATRGLHEDADLSGLHPRPNPPLEALDEIERRMGGAGGSFVVLVTADDDTTLLRRAWQVRRSLAATSAFGPASLLPDPDVAVRRMASSRDVDSVVADFRAAVADSDFAADAFDAYAAFLPKLLRPRTSPSVVDLRRFPTLASTMLAKSGHAATILITPRLRPVTPEGVSSFISNTRAALAKVDGVTLTGMAVLAGDTRANAKRDAGRIALTAVLAVTLVLAVHLRSVSLALLTVVPTAFSLACVLITMQVFGFGVNVVNLVMFPLLLGITIDYGIFVTDVLRRGVTDRPPERFLAATTALLTCVGTTFIGFGSLVTVSVPAVRSLGWLINVGLVACVVGALVMLWPMVLVIARRWGRL